MKVIWAIERKIKRKGSNWQLHSIPTFDGGFPMYADMVRREAANSVEGYNGNHYEWRAAKYVRSA